MARRRSSSFAQDMNLVGKLGELHWLLLLTTFLIAGVGLAMMYSVAGGNFDAYAMPQLQRFLLGVAVMLSMALIPLRFWWNMAFPIYIATLALLVFVEFQGAIGMGAQRWLDLGVIRLQPSELMKIALVLALARYLHTKGLEEARKLKTLFWPLLLALVPVGLVLRQPDLGTAMLILAGAGAVLYLAGVRTRLFVVGFIVALAAVPVAFNLLQPYQQERVTTFLNPEKDPLGAGYQIIQSKIAMGSGGLTGKGYMQGTQSQLKFLPEKQTDFIFTTVAEEFGLVGGLSLLALYGLLLTLGGVIAMRARSQFARLIAMGVSITFFLYVFINIGMVQGMLPVVGVPLPLVSYGGSAILTLCIGIGLLLNVHVHREVTITRQGYFK